MRMAWLTPGLVTLVGAILVAIGTFWQFNRQAQRSEEIAGLNREITRMTQENLAAVTGGDSFCSVFLVDPGDPAGPTMLISARGKHPVYDVTVQVADHRNFEDLKGPTPPPGVTAAQILSRYIVFPPRNVFPHVANTIGKLRPLTGDREAFNIVYFARNGTWTQHLRLRRTQDGWTIATKVQKGDGRPTDAVLLENIDPNFPRNAAGEVEW